MAFIDHDKAQRAEERRPPLVAWQQRVVQEVRISEYVCRVLADPSPFVRRRVAVVGRCPKPRDCERVDPRELVVS
jgi:hypothetical protein